MLVQLNLFNLISVILNGKKLLDIQVDRLGYSVVIKKLKLKHS